MLKSNLKWTENKMTVGVLVSSFVKLNVGYIFVCTSLMTAENKLTKKFVIFTWHW